MINNDALKLLKEKKYFKDNELCWEDLCSRVAKGISKAEDNDEKRKEIEGQIYGAMSSMSFVFSTPVLLNADPENPGQLSSCFICDTRDTIDDICRLDAEFAKIFQRNGGAGTDLSVLRPAKSAVNTSKGYSGGVITFMEKYDATADQMTKFNPSRKGALKVNLQMWHPQIIEFIHCKDDLTKFHRMNISVSMTDEFMNAVENDENWDLCFPDYESCKEIYDKEWDGDIDNWKNKGYPVKIYQTVKAKQLMKEITESSWKTAEPGVNFSSLMDKANTNKHISTKVYTNP